MPDGVVAVLLSAGAVVLGFAVIGQKLLFRWYLREIRRLDIPEQRRDAVATYPFA